MKYWFSPKALMIMAALALIPLSAAEGVGQYVQDLDISTPNEFEKFSTMFRDNVKIGCLSSVSSSIKNPKKYCECYADSYLQRYTNEDIALISENASKVENGGAVVAVMMRPDMRQCAAKSGRR